jgi:hypothetical protein
LICQVAKLLELYAVCSWLLLGGAESIGMVAILDGLALARVARANFDWRSATGGLVAWLRCSVGLVRCEGRACVGVAVGRLMPCLAGPGCRVQCEVRHVCRPDPRVVGGAVSTW